jgi:hypothetical protein
VNTMIWPDPNCRGPHKEGQRLLRWQHTVDCKLAAVNSRMFSGDVGEILRDGMTPEDATLVERARSAGAI